MKRLSIAVIALLISSFVFSLVAGELPSMYQSKFHKDIIPSFDKNIQISENAIRWKDVSHFGEMDEIIGDTLVLGTTWWESQHNGTVGRMIGMQPDRPDFGNTVHVAWMNLDGTNGDRFVMYTRAYSLSGMMVYQDEAPWRVDASDRSGYVTLGLHEESGTALPAYHATNLAADPYEVRLAAEWSQFEGVFSEFSLPNYGDMEAIWPHTTVSEYNDNIYVHTVSHENRGDDTSSKMVILYSRSTWDIASETLTAGEQQVITEDGMNISCDVAASYDGSRVALAQTVPTDPTAEELSQYDNDMYVWISEDGGETWNWDEPINITSFIPPNPELLPDTIAADRDILRCYTDVNVYFDYDNILHVAFTTPHFYHYEGTITYTSLVWHWDEVSDVFTVIADGQFWNNIRPGAWQMNAQRPNMYQDPESRVLYCVYQQYGVPGDTTDAGVPNDGSAGGFPSGEIMISATPPNNIWGDWYGRMWVDGVNLTNTRGVGGNIPAGECRSEREPSIALNNDGDYLNITYVLDLDAGFTEQTEGEHTECPVIWHRVDKEVLMSSFEEQGAWVPNSYIHVDSSQYWTDSEYEYTWDGGFFRIMGIINVDEKYTLLPDEFSLEQNFPNPFNPNTNIRFNLEKRGFVKLAVFDVLGREVSTLLDRELNAGSHSIDFNAGHLSSGVYFYRLSSGSAEKVRKMILMK